MKVICFAAFLCTSLLAQNDGRRLIPSNSGQRLALVVGNKDYKWKPLTNPVNDARDVADALNKVGFESSNIKLVLDAGRDNLRHSVREFIESVRPGDFAFVYFAGHGVEIRGDNYLLPVDLPSNPTEGLVQDEAISAQRLLSDLAVQGARVKVMILDACRDNPLKPGRSAAHGLAPMEGKGSLIVFATEAGKTASDNPLQHNGLFTHYLLEGLARPNVPLDDAMKQVSRNVAFATKEQQVPAIYGLMLEDVILSTSSATKVTVAASGPAKEDSAGWLKKEAAAGNIKAQAELGAWYEKGLIVEKSFQEALKWLRLAADHGSPEARYNLALMYAKGEGVPVNEDASTQLLTQAAEQGHKDAQYYLAQKYRTGESNIKQDFKTARVWYLKAALQGQLDAQNNLAALFHDGLGGPVDFAEAAKWMNKAAEQGDADAQSNLGLIYRKGEGIPQDYAASLEWLRKSAQQGNAHAEDQIGNAYAFGWGVPLNMAEAAKWYQKAAAKGQAEAEYNLAVCYTKNIDGLGQDYEKALIWFQRSAGHGDERAQAMLNSLIK